MKRIMSLAAVVPTVTLVGAVFATAGPADAATRTTPNGYVGALNMIGTNALPGMANAMSVNNPHGNLGMYCAVYVTNGLTAPGSCR